MKGSVRTMRSMLPRTRWVTLMPSSHYPSLRRNVSVLQRPRRLGSMWTKYPQIAGRRLLLRPVGSTVGDPGGRVHDLTWESSAESWARAMGGHSNVVGSPFTASPLEARNSPQRQRSPPPCLRPVSQVRFVPPSVRPHQQPSIQKKLERSVPSNTPPSPYIAGLAREPDEGVANVHQAEPLLVRVHTTRRVDGLRVRV